MDKKRRLMARFVITVLALTTMLPTLTMAVETDRITVEDPATGTVKFRVTSEGNISGSSLIADGKLGVGTTEPSTPLHVVGKTTVYQANKTASSQGFLLAGDGIAAASPASAEGAVFQLGYNGNGNRQLWLLDSLQMGLPTNYAFRYIVGFQLPHIGGVAADGSVGANINLQNGATGRVGIGMATSAAQSAVQAKLHIISGEAAVPAQIVQGAASQTANLTEWRNSSGTIKAAINPNGEVVFPDGTTQTTAAVTGSGTVTNITSANGDISIATTTTTPILTLNSGTGANQIIKLTSTGKLPAVDGSLLTGITAGTTPAGAVTGAIQGRNATGNGFVADNTIVVDSTNHRLGVGTSAPSTPLHVVGKSTVYQANKTAASQGLLLAGDGIAAASPVSNDGVVFQLGYNGSGNRQLWLLDSLQMGLTDKYAFRYIVGFPLPHIGAVTADGSVGGHLNIQNGTAGRVGIGMATSAAQSAVQAKLHINNGEAAVPAQIVQGAASQTANLTEWQDSSGSVQAAVTAGGKLEVNGGVRVNTTTNKPPCDDTTRGTFWFTNGATADDTMEVCAKFGGSNVWKTLDYR